MSASSNSREVRSAHCSSSKNSRTGFARARYPIQSVNTCFVIVRWRSELMSDTASGPAVEIDNRLAKIGKAVLIGILLIDSTDRSFRILSSAVSVSSIPAWRFSTVRNGYSVLFTNAGEHCTINWVEVFSLCCISLRSRDLPIPASPEITTTCPWPIVETSSQLFISRRTSGSRPHSLVSRVLLANRLGSERARRACQT